MVLWGLFVDYVTLWNLNFFVDCKTGGHDDPLKSLTNPTKIKKIVTYSPHKPHQCH